MGDLVSKCILWQASLVKTKVLLWATLLFCDLPEWTSVRSFKLTGSDQPSATNIFIRQPALINEMCTECGFPVSYSPRPWGILLNKKCLTLFLGMSNHWLTFYWYTVLIAPVPFNREPSEKTLPMDSKFLAREHPGVHPTHLGCTVKALRSWGALYKGKKRKTTKYNSTCSVCFPQFFSWQVNYQEEIK